MRVRGKCMTNYAKNTVIKSGVPSVDKIWLDNFEDNADKIPIPEMSVYDYMYQNNKEYYEGFAIEYFGKKSVTRFFLNK